MELGRLEQIDVRAVWENEARHFTPWLLANADRLAEVLGIDLELERAEHPVGGFALDLIGRDLTNDAVLIVENQIASQTTLTSARSLRTPLAPTRRLSSGFQHRFARNTGKHWTG